MLFQRLADYGVIINAEKSQLGQDDLEFLSHRITKGGLHPFQSRAAILPRDGKFLSPLHFAHFRFSPTS